MTHAAGTTLFAYWDSLRGGRPAPERSDIDPRAIGPILGDTFVLEGDLTGALPYRLAGSRISTLFAREMKGESFTALFTELGRQAFHRGLSDALAAQAGLSLAVTGTSTIGRDVDLEMTLLPLVHRGRLGARMIGTIAGPICPGGSAGTASPSWRSAPCRCSGPPPAAPRPRRRRDDQPRSTRLCRETGPAAHPGRHCVLKLCVATLR